MKVSTWNTAKISLIKPKPAEIQPRDLYPNFRLNNPSTTKQFVNESDASSSSKKFRRGYEAYGTWNRYPHLLWRLPLTLARFTFVLVEVTLQAWAALIWTITRFSIPVTEFIFNLHNRLFGRGINSLTAVRLTFVGAQVTMQSWAALILAVTRFFRLMTEWMFDFFNWLISCRVNVQDTVRLAFVVIKVTSQAWAALVLTVTRLSRPMTERIFNFSNRLIGWHANSVTAMRDFGEMAPFLNSDLDVHIWLWLRGCTHESGRDCS